MARQIIKDTDKFFVISKFLGVNQAPDGDSNLRLGEASAMANFKITDTLSLQKRPGTQNVAGLISEYTITVASEPTMLSILQSDTFAAYPNVSVSVGGILSLSGTPVTITYDNHASYADYYYQDSLGLIHQFADCVYTQAAGTHVSGGSVTISGTPYNGQAAGNVIFVYPDIIVANGAVSTSGTGVSVSDPTAAANKYYAYGGTIYQISSLSQQVAAVYVPGMLGIGAHYEVYYYIDWTGYAVSFSGNDTYNWNFYAVTATTGSTDTSVKGIWSGRVGTIECIVAACNGHLWVLAEEYGVWSKADIGTITTTNARVHMFGFDGKLYIMNGSQYKSWDAQHHMVYTYSSFGADPGLVGDYYITINSVNYKFSANVAFPNSKPTIVFDTLTNILTINGTGASYTTGAVTTQTDLMSLTYNVMDAGTFSAYGLAVRPSYDSNAQTVNGYRPLIADAVPYNGGGTLLERVNILTGTRRVWYSPDGSHATFTLPEKGIASVDYAKTIATGAALTVSSSDLTNGTTTLSAPPASGTNTIEIGYTMSSAVITGMRNTILGMTRTEFYNGANDNRIFFYGDGSNKAYYSDLDNNGQPTAEYIPDLNVVSVGDVNTPIYDMLRHYNELMCFKSDSTYRMQFGDITLPGSDVVTAAFYTQTVNKELGGSGYGQAQLVENQPRTLDGRSIYTWVSATSTGGITTDQRNAQRISQKVSETIRAMTLADAVTYYDKINHEYFIVENGTAIVQNAETITQNNPLGYWYIYQDFPAVCLINYKDDLYFGTADGYVRRVSRDYLHDCGEPIACSWESGSMDFGASSREKFSDLLWIRLMDEDNAAASATLETDNNGVFSNYALASGEKRLAFKAKDYTWIKLNINSTSNNTTATVLKAEIRVRPTGLAK